MVNFVGPILFVIVGRYHGGAFVVFSKTLNPSVQVIVTEGSYPSVVDGTPTSRLIEYLESLTECAKQSVRVVTWGESSLVPGGPVVEFVQEPFELCDLLG